MKENDEVIYGEGMSSCCGAAVYAETDICSDCKEHCDIVYEDEEDEKLPPEPRLTMAQEDMIWDGRDR